MIHAYVDRFGFLDWEILAGSYNLASSVLFYFYSSFLSVLPFGIDNRADFFETPLVFDLSDEEVPF